MRSSALLLHANRHRWIASKSMPCSNGLNAVPMVLMNSCTNSSNRRWFGVVKTPTATTSVDSHHHHDDHHDHHHDDDHHDDHHHHKPLGPYEVPHHPTYPKKAYFLGINPNEKYKWEGWEIITYLTYASCFIVLVYGYNANNKNAFKVNNVKEYHLSIHLSIIIIIIIYHMNNNSMLYPYSTDIIILYSTNR